MRRTLSQTLFFFIALIALLTSTACSAEVTTPDTPTATKPIIITATLPPTQTPHPSTTPEPATATLPVAPIEGQTTSQLNVRSIPSADGELLGMVDIFAKVQIVGKDPTSSWWMIVYPESPNGTGWITAQFVQVADPSGVPVIGVQPQATTNADITEAPPNSSGEAASTLEAGSDEAPSLAPTSMLATAYPDGDSYQSPAVSITLSEASVRYFNFSSDVSSPKGDTEDWVQFLLEGQVGQEKIVSVVLNCSGSSGLNVELIQNQVLLQGWENLTCGQPSQLQLYLFPGAPYFLRLWPAQGNNSVNYVAYTVTVQLAK